MENLLILHLTHSICHYQYQHHFFFYTGQPRLLSEILCTSPSLSPQDLPALHQYQLHSCAEMSLVVHVDTQHTKLPLHAKALWQAYLHLCLFVRVYAHVCNWCAETGRAVRWMFHWSSAQMSFKTHLLSFEGLSTDFCFNDAICFAELLFWLTLLHCWAKMVKTPQLYVR